MYEVKDPICQFVDHWQTLIAGGLALVAGIGAVVGTLTAANRQVKAANDAADRQVAAAQEQVAAARHETEVMREMERRRISREGFAFYAMLRAAMGAVIEDIGAAQELLEANRPGARQRIKRAGFAELRPAFLRFGGTTLTEKFLRLDKEIDDFASGVVYAGLLLEDQLERIEGQAMELRSEAEFGIKATSRVVGNDLA